MKKSNNEDELSVNYLSSIEAHDIAIKAYKEASKKFYSREINDDEFLISVKAMRIADAAFDLAYDSERNRIVYN